MSVAAKTEKRLFRKHECKSQAQRAEILPCRYRQVTGSDYCMYPGHIMLKGKVGWGAQANCTCGVNTLLIMALHLFIS